MPAHHGSATARRPNPPSPTRTRETLNPPSPRSRLQRQNITTISGHTSQSRKTSPGCGARVGSGQRRQTELGQRPLNTPLGELRQITPRTPPGSCLFAIDQNTTSTAALAAGDCCCAAAPPGPSPRAGSSGAPVYDRNTAACRPASPAGLGSRKCTSTSPASVRPFSTASYRSRTPLLHDRS